MRLISFAVILFWMLSVSLSADSPLKDLHGWALIVDITKYNDPEIAITNLKDSLADKLKMVLMDVGGFPEDQIFTLKDRQCTFRGLKLALENLSQMVEKNDRFILFFRGCVTKPSTVKPAYLLTYDTPEDNMDKAISEKLLGQWLSKIKAEDQILIMDYYTFKSNAKRYTINRATIGTSSINMFQPTSTKIDLFGEKMIEALKSSETDTDDTRLISVRELYEYVIRESGMYLSPIGNLDATLIELPSMLQIKSIPPEGIVHVNGKKIGLTPQRIIEELKPQSYEIEVHKKGYLTPEKGVTRIRRLRGESVDFMFDLIPIKVYGKVKMASTEKLPGNVEVEVKDRAISVDNNGNYSFDDWDKQNLEIGKKYKLVARSSDLYYGSAEFVLDGEEDIHQDIELRHRDWYEVAQIRFDREDYEEAVEAFQTGVEEDPNFTEVSPDFADVLYDYFKELIILVPDNLNYIIATARLAEQLKLKKEAERYWRKVEKKSAPESISHQLAIQHLKELAPHRGLIKLILIVALIATSISGGYLIYKHKKTKWEV